MRHFVKNGVCAPVVLFFGGLATEYKRVFVEGNAASVLHGARVEFGHCDLVVLSKRVSETKFFFEEGEATLGKVKEFFWVEEWCERLAAIDTKGNFAMRALITVVYMCVRTGNKCGDIGGDARSSGKSPNVFLSAYICARIDWIVGDKFPVRRCGGGKGESSLQIWLIKAGIHATGICCFELGIEVDLIVCRVGKAVKSLTGVHEAGIYFDDESIFAGQVIEEERLSIELICVDCLSVEFGFDQFLGDNVNKG